MQDVTEVPSGVFFAKHLVEVLVKHHTRTF